MFNNRETLARCSSDSLAKVQAWLAEDTRAGWQRGRFGLDRQFTNGSWKEHRDDPITPQQNHAARQAKLALRPKRRESSENSRDPIRHAIRSRKHGSLRVLPARDGEAGAGADSRAAAAGSQACQAQELGG